MCSFLMCMLGAWVFHYLAQVLEIPLLPLVDLSKNRFFFEALATPRSLELWLGKNAIRELLANPRSNDQKGHHDVDQDDDLIGHYCLDWPKTHKSHFKITDYELEPFVFFTPNYAFVDRYGHVFDI